MRSQFGDTFIEIKDEHKIKLTDAAHSDEVKFIAEILRERASIHNALAMNYLDGMKPAEAQREQRYGRALEDAADFMDTGLLEALREDRTPSS